MDPKGQINEIPMDWMDALRPCPQTGCAYAENRSTDQNSSHPYEDFSCSYQFNPNISFYGLFDGYGDGKIAQNFAIQFIANLYFAQLEKNNCDQTNDEIKQILMRTFSTVEKSYMESTTTTDSGISIVSNAGCEVGVALIHDNRLYVGNIGTCRVLLCRTDPTDGVLKVLQLSTDHNLYNPEEIGRLQRLNLDPIKLRTIPNGIIRNTTRFLGCAALKIDPTQGHSPWLAAPDDITSIPLDSQCRFLVLITGAVVDVLGAETNRRIVQIIVDQCRQHTNMGAVVQNVVAKIVGVAKTKSNYEDITIIIRNFNYPLMQISSTNNNNWSSNSTTTSGSTVDGTNILPDQCEQRIPAYVDFEPFYTNLDAAKRCGTINLPDFLLD